MSLFYVTASDLDELADNINKELENEYWERILYGQTFFIPYHWSEGGKFAQAIIETGKWIGKDDNLITKKDSTNESE